MSNAAQIDILGVHTHAQRFDDAVSTLVTWASDQQRRYVCTCPVYTVMVCTENPAARKAVNAADMVTADGMPVVWVQRWWGFPAAERVYGPDLLQAMCERTAGQGVRHFFWGGLPGVADTLAVRLKTRFPALEIAGTCSPPVADVGELPDPAVVEQINAAQPDVVWVGLGSPKQDLWMALYRPALNAPLLIGVGAAFDFLAGVKRQAPRWAQRNGLEWLFRLIQEPGRLWRRYLIYNPRFVWGVFRQHMSRSRQS